MTKKEFTATQVMALQEEMHKGIKVIGEQHQEIIGKFSVVNQQFVKIDKRFDHMGLQMDKMVQRMDRMENNIDRMEDNIELIKFSLREKADTVELRALEKRVIILEKKTA